MNHNHIIFHSKKYPHISFNLKKHNSQTTQIINLRLKASHYETPTQLTDPPRVHFQKRTFDNARARPAFAPTMKNKIFIFMRRHQSPLARSLLFFKKYHVCVYFRVVTPLTMRFETTSRPFFASAVVKRPLCERVQNAVI